MKTILTLLALVLMGSIAIPSASQAKNRKPRYECTGACPGGGNSVVIYYDNDADADYDYRITIDCAGKRTRENGDWPDITGSPSSESGLTLVDAFNPTSQIYAWQAVYSIGGVEVLRLSYDGTEGGVEVED